MTSAAENDGLLLGDLEVERLLGEGGMGRVWLVRSCSTGERFAMKRTRFEDWAGKRNFLLELQTWYGLPAHPHLAACRFFRTLESEIAIFAEYVSGGSLADWIEERKLTTLDQILDLAIQFAWGLHAAHECGVLHQDVKPSNVLIAKPIMATSDDTPSNLIVKVSDFGLAREGAMRNTTAADDPHQSALVTARCGTLPYCSPEQALGLPLTRKTDVWSWGVSVLEMFTGEVTWYSGTLAAEVLEDYLKYGASPGLPRMPQSLADVLRTCFREDPAERPQRLAEVADVLCNVYCRELERGYPRAVPPAVANDARWCLQHDRRFGNVQWDDPQRWLAVALKAAGRDRDEAAGMLPKPVASRKGQAIGDLIGYEEARRIFESLEARGNATVDAARAELCTDKALAHRYLDDAPGAFALYGEAIAIYERLVHQEGRGDLANDLAGTYQDKANAFCKLGELAASLPLYDQAIAICKRLVDEEARGQEGRVKLANDLATLFANKGNALRELGKLWGAVRLYDQAISIRRRLVDEEARGQEGRVELANDLAMDFQNKGTALAELRNLRAALRLFDQAITIYERLVDEEHRGELVNVLAKLHLNKAEALRQSGELRAALPLYDKSIAIYERLIHEEGRGELAEDLATFYQNKANAVADLRDPQVALALYDQAIAILTRLVREESRGDLANNLARVYRNKAIAVADLGDRRAALPLYDQAIAIRNRLVHEEGRVELANDLAGTYGNKANALVLLGELRAAVPLYVESIAIYGRLVHEERRGELRNDLAQVYQKMAIVAADLGDPRAALPLYDQAIAIRERLVKEGNAELLGDLAGCRVLRAFAWLRLGQRERARAEAREVIPVLEEEIRRSGRADSQKALNLALALKDKM